jgi:hypothetical protein
LKIFYKLDARTLQAMFFFLDNSNILFKFFGFLNVWSSLWFAAVVVGGSTCFSIRFYSKGCPSITVSN